MYSYDVGIKRRLLEYASTAMLFSDNKVDPNIVAWNRVVLLHGPPGTGKTRCARCRSAVCAVLILLLLLLQHVQGAGTKVVYSPLRQISQWTVARDQCPQASVC